MPYVVVYVWQGDLHYIVVMWLFWLLGIVNLTFCELQSEHPDLDDPQRS